MKAWKFFNWVCEKNGFRLSSSVEREGFGIFGFRLSYSAWDFWTHREIKEKGFSIDACGVEWL